MKFQDAKAKIKKVIRKMERRERKRERQTAITKLTYNGPEMKTASDFLAVH